MGYKLLLSSDDVPLQIAIDHESPYQGIIFNFRTISMKETIFGNCKLKFTYDIIEDPNNIVAKLDRSAKMEFEQYLGNCLLEIVLGIDKNRDDNTEESTEQRDIYEEGITPPEK